MKRPLEGLRSADYYGCLLVRPPDLADLDDPEHPTVMDGILRALAHTRALSYSVECCGASLSIGRSDIVADWRANRAEREAGANCS